MSTIVAGRFDSFADAERAARGLYGHGFSVWDVSIFTVGTPQATQELARPPGVLLAARVEPERLQTAAELIRLEGGRELEQAEGQWENGRWSDFDPLGTPKPLQETAPHERAGQLGEGALSATGNEDPGSEIDQSVRQDEDRHPGQVSGQAGGHAGGQTGGQPGGHEAGNGERDLGVLLTPGQHTTTHEGVSKGDEGRMQGQRAGEPRQQDAGSQTGSAAEGSSPGASEGATQDVGQGKSEGTSQGAGHGATQGQSPAQREGQGQHPAEQQPREAWESAQSHRQPGEKTDEPELVRGATTTPEPSGPNDTFRQIRRGQFPPGVGEGDLRDPGSTTPDAPKVDNRS
ncbi:hypothetical protein [Cupriavidus cauae]|uniref:hypothetical protein n=1 Tax=Cupriavidus cauae TaxID=2608999 RepID=UPI0016814477|nr:hypothetical protein [Cupriavidus cauae]